MAADVAMTVAKAAAKLVAVVRSLYSQSTISIRLSMDGELAPSFVQKKGSRQGSGLSPCIFTMPVDFAMKVADMACEELGMIGSEDEDKRGAYADDVAERTRNEEEASVSLQQFEAAAGYGGLVFDELVNDTCCVLLFGLK